MKRSPSPPAPYSKSCGIQLDVVFECRNFAKVHIRLDDGKIQGLDRCSERVLRWVDEQGLSQDYADMDLEHYAKVPGDPTTNWPPTHGRKANIYLTFKVTERQLSKWQEADWARLELFGTKATLTGTQHTGRFYKLEEDEIIGESSESDMQLDAVPAVPNPVPNKIEEELTADEELAFKAAQEAEERPPGMESATPTCQTDMKKTTCSRSSNTKSNTEVTGP